VVTGASAQIRVAEDVNELELALADNDAFEAWYRRMLPRVYGYLVGRCGNDVALAEELSQQTFVAAINESSRFDGRSDIVTWLCGIARHKLADHFRAADREERRRMRLEVRWIETTDRAAAVPEVDDRVAIADALRSLPAAQQAVLVFVVLDDLSVADAGRLLGRSTPATYSLLHRAREAFRQAYGREVDR
jgi:RNA polymerase sigma-70 factor, ECF subfamily